MVDLSSEWRTLNADLALSVSSGPPAGRTDLTTENFSHHTVYTILDTLQDTTQAIIGELHKTINIEGEGRERETLKVFVTQAHHVFLSDSVR